ncbi:MAG: ABC transporter ATP-binding protein [Gammaproteobacteria bacterium]|nr:ABC transporter ATP-binding protein [Gammaproteobacteria bacterium]
MSIAIQDVCKYYGTTRVVNRVSVSIDDGEFFVLLGPSGSGKSTLLRIIAGLTSTDAGRIVLNGRDVTLLPPQQRGVGFVFQNYALFKHMTVAENIAYGLKVRKLAANQRHDRVQQMLELVGLSGYGQRVPGQLSGGQQQRVALARALAFNPQILLLDEPFGALDAQIRTDLRRSVRRIQQEIGITTILVTHDQDEAFAMGDSIGVMHDGELIETGPAERLYQSPAHEFSAAFLGNANLLAGVMERKGIRIGDALLHTEFADCTGEDGQIVKLMVRPEDIELSRYLSRNERREVAEGVITERQFSGPVERLRVEIELNQTLHILHPPVANGAKLGVIEVMRTRPEALRNPMTVGHQVKISFNHVHALEILTDTPVLGGQDGIDFIASMQQDSPGAEYGSSQALTSKLFDHTPANTDNNILLVWFGAARRIDRVVINLSGHVANDRQLLKLAQQLFRIGRPPMIELLEIAPADTPHEDARNVFLRAARNDLQQLGSVVRSRRCHGDEISELRNILSQSDTDLLLTAMPSAAGEALQKQQLADWVKQQYGPISTCFVRASAAEKSAAPAAQSALTTVPLEQIL